MHKEKEGRSSTEVETSNTSEKYLKKCVPCPREAFNRQVGELALALSKETH